MTINIQIKCLKSDRPGVHYLLIIEEACLPTITHSKYKN